MDRSNPNRRRKMRSYSSPPPCCSNADRAKFSLASSAITTRSPRNFLACLRCFWSKACCASAGRELRLMRRLPRMPPDFTFEDLFNAWASDANMELDDFAAPPLSTLPLPRVSAPSASESEPGSTPALSSPLSSW